MSSKTLECSIVQVLCAARSGATLHMKRKTGALLRNASSVISGVRLLKRLTESRQDLKSVRVLFSPIVFERIFVLGI